jgi:hypothetical protein
MWKGDIKIFDANHGGERDAPPYVAANRPMINEVPHKRKLPLQEPLQHRNSKKFKSSLITTTVCRCVPVQLLEDMQR